MLTKMGHKGFEEHVKHIQEQYARRAGIISAAADKHLRGLAEWHAPEAGMFMWLKLLHTKDASDLLSKMEGAGVIVVPGILASLP